MLFWWWWQLQRLVLKVFAHLGKESRRCFNLSHLQFRCLPMATSLPAVTFLKAMFPLFSWHRTLELLTCIFEPTHSMPVRDVFHLSSRNHTSGQPKETGHSRPFSSQEIVHFLQWGAFPGRHSVVIMLFGKIKIFTQTNLSRVLIFFIVFSEGRFHLKKNKKKTLIW